MAARGALLRRRTQRNDENLHKTLSNDGPKPSTLRSTSPTDNTFMDPQFQRGVFSHTP